MSTETQGEIADVKGVYVTRRGDKNVLGVTYPDGLAMSFVLNNDQLQTIIYMASHVMWANFKLTERER